jgi:murein DD-endopeptidase MepM/ murein hydrolase activator NlpD
LRSITLVLVTAAATAALTSAAWFAPGLLRNETASPAPTATIPISPKPQKPQPAVQNAPPRETPPRADVAPVAAPATTTTRIGEVPPELLAKRIGMPVPGISKESLQPAFYDDRGQRGHEAIDIMTARGEPVVAVEDGVIAKLFTSVRGGLTIYQFDSTRTYAYYYAHLDHYAEGLKEGDPVSRGQLLGTVGSTGNADTSSPHLHFAIFLLGPEKLWWKGEPLDPYPALTAPP